MEIVNATPVPAAVRTSILSPTQERIGVVVAKATFRITSHGAVLERQNPYPLLTDDEKTPLGAIPRDDLPRRDRVFEVILLGAAHAPAGTKVAERLVSLAVGDTRREILVIGDRAWTDPDKGPSAPIPFDRMPLTWDRAFGGTVQVEIDRGSFLPVADARNPEGRGFDPVPAATGIASALKCPEGYPRFDRRRRLPNLEDPCARIARFDDAPDPVCWAPVPLASSIQAMRSVAHVGEAIPFELLESANHRAHPSWILREPPPPGAEVEMEGLCRGADVVRFSLPRLRVFVDYVAAGRTGARELDLHGMVLLPEELKLALVFRHAFTFEYGGERSMRLRVEEH